MSLAPFFKIVVIMVNIISAIPSHMCTNEIVQAVLNLEERDV